MVDNVTGWNELMDTQVINAAYELFNEATVGYGVSLLFMVFLFTLYMKTESPFLVWITSIIFLVMYFSMMKTTFIGIYVVVIVFALALTLYDIFFANK